MECVLKVDTQRLQLEEQANTLSDQLSTLEGQEADQLNTKLCEIYERLEALDAATANARASTILTGLGFDVDAQNKKTKDFSGGWRMRIALARALFICPTFLILDEPTNHLVSCFLLFFILGNLFIDFLVIRTWSLVFG